MFDQRKAYFITKCDEQLLQIATAFSQDCQYLFSGLFQTLPINHGHI